MASSKRLDLSTLADATPATPSPNTVLRPDGRHTRVPLTRISPNRVNPRTDFGTPKLLADFGRSLGRRQLQPVLCVSKRAYLQLYPEHAEQLDHDGRVDVVLVNGERRYRGALAAGLQYLDAVIDDTLAESRQAFMDAVYTENKDRENFNPIEEAHAIDALVAEFGSTNAVAEHYDRSKTWVVQRRNLLKLTDELQALTISGEIPVRVARELATLGPGDQMPAWEVQKAAPKAARKPRSRKDLRDPVADAPAGAAQVGERVAELGRQLDLDVSLLRVGKSGAVTVQAEVLLGLLERLSVAERRGRMASVSAEAGPSVAP